MAASQKMAAAPSRSGTDSVLVLIADELRALKWVVEANRMLLLHEPDPVARRIHANAGEEVGAILQANIDALEKSGDANGPAGS